MEDAAEWVQFSVEYAKAGVPEMEEADEEWYRYCLRRFRNKRRIAALDAKAAKDRWVTTMQRVKSAARRTLAKVSARQVLRPYESVVCSHPQIPFDLADFSA